MYVIKTDGRLLYSPELTNDGFKVYSPKMHMEVNSAGSLDFTLPPCNTLYADIHKMKSIVTVEQDGEEVFRGRVLEENMDFYRQKQIYCEGDLSFLLDSLQAPFNFEGTPAELFVLLVSAHNSQMDESKRFVVGDVSGLDNVTVIKIASTSFADTSSTIQTLLLDVYGGYIRTRKTDGVYYVDYIAEYTHECTQTIEFGVNMLDIDSQIDASELCTVLVPLGAATGTGDALTIAEVNDGSVYIENEELIARYGRIYKTYTWDQVTDPAQLLQLGQAFLQQVALSETLTIRAVDMHLVDGDVEKIKLGDKVLLKSPAHGLDRVSVCSVLDIDLQNGGQSEYTFGLPKQTMADQAVSTASQIDKAMNDINDQHRWLTETDEALNIAVQNINLIGHRTSAIEADFNAAKAEIALKANQTSVDILGERLSGAEVRISGAEAAIELKAGQDVVDKMGERLTTAEVKIDGAASQIALKADKIELEGYVKMEDFEAVEGWTDIFASERVETPWLEGGTVNADNVIAPKVDADAAEVGAMTCETLNGQTPKWTGMTVLTGIGTVSQSKRFLDIMLADGSTAQLDIVTDVSITPSSAYIEYLGKG